MSCEPYLRRTPDYHGKGQILKRQPMSEQHPKFCPNCHPGSNDFAWFCPNLFSLFWPHFQIFGGICTSVAWKWTKIRGMLQYRCQKKNSPHPLTKSTSQPPGLWYFGQSCPNSRSRLPNLLGLFCPISHQAFFQNFAKCVRIGIHPLPQ